MTIEQLIKELSAPIYKDEEKKVERVRKHLKVDYVDYLAKMELCRQILSKSMYAEVNGRVIYKPNSPMRYMLTISALLQAYYDFDLSKVFMEDFNALEKNDMTKLIIKGIGADMERFSGVMTMMVDDLDYANSLVPFLDTKTEAIGMSLDAFKNVAETKNEEEKEESKENVE